MMLGVVLLAVVSLVVTNRPSSFSTMVERTLPCPVVSEPKVGMKFDLDLTQSSDCRIEVAVGHDADGDGCLFTGPSESSLSITSKRVHDVLVLTIR